MGFLYKKSFSFYDQFHCPFQFWFLHWLILFFLNPHSRMCLLIWEREGERDREREKHWCKRETSIGDLPFWASNLQPRHVHWPGFKPKAFWCVRQCSNQLSYLARAHWLILQKAFQIPRSDKYKIYFFSHCFEVNL